MKTYEKTVYHFISVHTFTLITKNKQK